MKVIESFLCNYLKTTHFSIHLDESTLPDNETLLSAYVPQKDNYATEINSDKIRAMKSNMIFSKDEILKTNRQLYKITMCKLKYGSENSNNPKPNDIRHKLKR